MNPEISILIITHNQRLLLERCLDSVLKQIINVPYEIIVSDDGDDDGTEAFIKQLSCSERVLEIKNLLGIVYVHCDSTVVRPLVSLRRMGWNRLTAYKLARGKYFVNFDADDFLIGTDLYQNEYDMLESHPECSMVQTRIYKLDEGESIDKKRAGFPNSERLENGAIFSLEDVLCYGLRGNHQTYMFRRRPQDDVELLYGAKYEDIVVTYHHLQYGPVVFLDQAGYIWIQNPFSSSHSGNGYDDGKVNKNMIPLYLAVLMKESKYIFLRNGIKKLKHWTKVNPSTLNLSDSFRTVLSAEDVFLFRYYSLKQHGLFDRLRYRVVCALLKVMDHYRLSSKLWLDMLYWTAV